MILTACCQNQLRNENIVHIAWQCDDILRDLFIPITFLQEQPTWQCTTSPKIEILAKNFVLVMCYEFTPWNCCSDIFWVVSVSQAPFITDEFAMSMGWAPWGGPYSHRCGPSGFEVRRPKKGIDPTECFSHPKKSCDLKSLGESPEACKTVVQWFLGQVFSLVAFFVGFFWAFGDTGLWQNRRVLSKSVRREKNSQKGWSWWQPVRIFGVGLKYRQVLGVAPEWLVDIQQFDTAWDEGMSPLSVHTSKVWLMTDAYSCLFTASGWNSCCLQGEISKK